jgi:peptidoglycan/xylan/chitin deacetylase (PgdA/CDA1 family)
MKRVTGLEPSLLRPPYGRYSHDLLRTASALGYQAVTWNVDAQDRVPGAPEAMADRIARDIKPGAIVLLSADDSNAQAAAALPQLLAQLRQQRYTTVTVSQLMQKHSQRGFVRN